MLLVQWNLFKSPSSFFLYYGTWKMKGTVSLAAGCESESHLVMSNCLQPHRVYSPWNSPGQNIGAVSLSLLQGIFPTQGLKPGLLHCWWILYHLSHRGSLLGVVTLFLLIKRMKAYIWERLLFPNKKKIKLENFCCLHYPFFFLLRMWMWCLECSSRFENMRTNPQAKKKLLIKYHDSVSSSELSTFGILIEWELV